MEQRTAKKYRAVKNVECKWDAANGREKTADAGQKF